MLKFAVVENEICLNALHKSPKGLSDSVLSIVHSSNRYNRTKMLGLRKLLITESFEFDVSFSRNSKPMKQILNKGSKY